MTKPHPKPIYEKIGEHFRRRARTASRGELLVLAAATFPQLTSLQLHNEDALALLARWLTPFMRRVPDDVIVKTVLFLSDPSSRQAGLSDEDRTIIVGCMLSLQQRVRREGVAAARNKLLIWLVVTQILQWNSPHPLRRAVVTLAITSSLGDERDEGRMLHATLVHRHAELLSANTSPEYVDLAIQEYRRALALFAPLIEAGVLEVAFEYARCLNNLGQTLCECSWGDICANLREAIDIFDDCLALPARQEDPGAMTLTLQSRTAAVNALVQLIHDVDEKIALLTDAIALAEAGLAHAGRKISGTPYNLPYLRETLWLAWTNARFLLLLAEQEKGIRTPEQTQALLRAHHDSSIKHLNEVADLIGLEAHTISRQWSTLMSELQISVNAEELGQYLQALVERLGTTQEHLNHVDAVLLLTQLHAYTGDRLHAADWRNLGHLIDSLNPVTVGMRGSWEIFSREYLLLTRQIEQHGSQVTQLLQDYATQHLHQATRFTRTLTLRFNACWKHSGHFTRAARCVAEIWEKQPLRPYSCCSLLWHQR